MKNLVLLFDCMTFLRAHLRAVIITILVVAVGGFIVYSGQKPQPLELVTAERRSLVQSVVVTGSVKPAEDLDLTFEGGGRIARMMVNTGAKVTAGQVLAELDSAELRASLSQAEAAVAIERANLDELIRGTRPEELAIEVTKTENATRALADAKADFANTEAKAVLDLQSEYNEVPNVLQSAYLNAQDAVTKQLDPLFTGVLSGSPKLSFVTSDTQAQIDSEAGRLQMDALLDTFNSEVNGLATSTEARDQALISAAQRLSDVRQLLDRVNATTNASTNLSAANLAAYKGYINTARSNVNTSQTSITTLQQSIATQRAVNQNAITLAKTKVNDAERALSVQQQQLKLKQAGATPSQIASAEARVRQAEANASVASARLTKNVLRAPIDGVITKRSAESGESVAPNAPVLTMISSSDLELEANIPEVDIGKIELGDSVSITIDAYSGETFSGAVTYIDPAETIIDGVVNFRIKIGFQASDDRLKSGLTANLTIETNRKDNVVALPMFVVIENERGSFVQKPKGEHETQEASVGLGLRSSDGYVEVTSGVVEGEAVVNVGATKK